MLRNKSKIFATSLVLVIIVLSSFVALYQTQVKAQQPYTLNVALSGPNKVGAQTPTTYTASVNNSAGSVAYSWNINPITLVTIQPEGANCILTFTDATEETYTLTVKATDSAGNTGSQSKIVLDPYTTSNLYLGFSAVTSSTVVEADRLGWYHYYNGTTLQEIAQSTNPSTIINGALALGGDVFIKNGSYTGASLTVPAGVNLKAEAGTTGIKYSSIGAGARIDEPSFNTCFGGYSGGSYTIVTGSSAVSSGVAWYLALKPDNSISWSSTNATYILVTALDNGNSIVVSGGTYPTIITIPANKTLQINQGVTAISYVVSSGDNINDYCNGKTYVNGIDVTPQSTSKSAPVLYLPFSEGSGNRTLDRSTFGNVAQLESTAAWTTDGKYGNGVELDGTSAYVQVNNSPSLNSIGAAFTLQISVYISADTLEHGVIGVWDDDSWGASFGITWVGTNAATNQAPFYGYLVTEAGTYTAYTTNSYGFDQWYTVTLTYDGTNMKMYVNGVASGTPTAATGNTIANSYNVLIGRQYTQYFAGIVDEVLLYAYAMSTTEISAQQTSRAFLPMSSTISDDYSAFNVQTALEEGATARFFREGSSHVSDDGAIMAQTYNTVTETWNSVPFVVYNSSYDDRNLGVGVIGSQVFLFFDRLNITANTVEMGFIASTDLTLASWSNFTLLTDVYWASPFGNLISGENAATFYLPIYNTDYWYNSNITIWRTTDSGATWSLYSTLYSGTTLYTEFTITSIGGGKVIANIRLDGTATLYQATSSDWCETWTDLTATNIGSGLSGSIVPNTIYDSTSGNLVLFYWDAGIAEMKVCVSNALAVYSNALAYASSTVLDSTSTFEATYPSAVMLSSGEYFVCYHRAKVLTEVIELWQISYSTSFSLPTTVSGHIMMGYPSGVIYSP